ncbi:MAG: hypothetical protein E7277_01390 [Lachnospiraceae bacterium]|nr:hypothetical protein [Lachnospiraceae bacterium]
MIRQKENFNPDTELGLSSTIYYKTEWMSILQTADMEKDAEEIRVDRPFGFAVTDENGIVLFESVKWN